MWKTKFSKVKNSLLELEKYFQELKDKEATIKRALEHQLFKLVNVCIDDMGKFDQNKMRRKTYYNTSYDHSHMKRQ